MPWPLASIPVAITGRSSARKKRYHPRSLDKPELIRTMRDAHQGMAEAIEHLPDKRLLEPAMDDWTGKDLLAHMAWWHDHSVLVIEGLRAAPAVRRDGSREHHQRDQRADPPRPPGRSTELTRRAFNESFTRILAALEPVTDEELFVADRWPWLGGEALIETILWDSSRHYDAHREHLERLSR